MIARNRNPPACASARRSPCPPSSPLSRAAKAQPCDPGSGRAVISQIKFEGFQHSSVMETLSYLTDVYGPRLTGSPNLKAAAEWSRDQLTKWGLENAALEPYGDIGRGWSVQRFSIEMMEPQYMRIIGYPNAWSPATPGPLSGTPILVEVKSKDDFEKYRGKLKGAIVMNGRPSRMTRLPARSQPPVHDELKKQERQIEPAPAGFGAPKSFADEEEDSGRRWTSDRRSTSSSAPKASRRCSSRAASVSTSSGSTASTSHRLRRIPASCSRASTTAASCGCSTRSTR